MTPLPLEWLPTCGHSLCSDSERLTQPACGKAPCGKESPVTGPSAEPGAGPCGCWRSRSVRGGGAASSHKLHCVSSGLCCCWEASGMRLAWEAAFPPCQPPDTNSPTDLCLCNNLPAAQAAPPGPRLTSGGAQMFYKTPHGMNKAAPSS